MRVFVTRGLPGTALDRLRREHDVDVWRGDTPPPVAELAERAAAADGLLTLLTDMVDETLLGGAPQLKAISNYAVGYENIDIAAATRRGIPVGHTPGVLTGATAQLTLTLILDLLRRVSEANLHVRGGKWTTWGPSAFLGTGLDEVTLGIVGYGRIGRRVGDLARALGMRVQHHDPQAEGMPLDQLLATSDVVSLHAALTPDTLGLIDADRLAAMRPGALLVNVARGRMVDTSALVAALERGWIGGAALDVTDPEPLPADHPLLGFPTVIVTPHIASATGTTRGRMADIAVDNLLAGLRGEPMPHGVNLEVHAGADAASAGSGG